MPERYLTRAYTLRLRGPRDGGEEWRDRVWATHEAVNAGARIFGDWLLTMRGGLAPCHAEKDEDRVVLALSWLSVESEAGAPSKYVISTSKDSPNERAEKLSEALKKILRDRGVGKQKVDEWVSACRPSLEAAIRRDAVWINRAEAFNQACKDTSGSLYPGDEWDMLERLFGSRKSYLALPHVSTPESEAQSDGEPGDDSKDQDDGGSRTMDLVKEAGQWLSRRFGTGKGACFSDMAGVYKKIEKWARHQSGVIAGSKAVSLLAGALGASSQDLTGILAMISGPGYKSATRNFLSQFEKKAKLSQRDFKTLQDKAADDARKCEEKIGLKGRLAYSDKILKEAEAECGFKYLQPDGPARHSEFAVMLDHAARRVSQVHTWMKRAEAQRRVFEGGRQKKASVPQQAVRWLDRYCHDRSEASGALGEEYAIRRRALGGWDEIAGRWVRCKTAEERIEAIHEVQRDHDEEKFGDARLFEDLASDEAMVVWCDNSKAMPAWLKDFAMAQEAERQMQHFKVPAYRHPDPLRHPVFCDFGKSRWAISFAAHDHAKDHAAEADTEVHTAGGMKDVSLSLLTSGGDVAPHAMRWQSRRLERDLALGPSEGGEAGIEVSRADRLGRAAAGAKATNRLRILGVFADKDWNGRLQAPRAELDAMASVRDSARFNEAEKMRKLKAMAGRLGWFVTFSPRLRPKGPWLEYAVKYKLKPTAWPFNDENKKRDGRARLALCRLPGLRVLSVDLGHRNAAACAVWETASAAQVKDACDRAGRTAPDRNSLFIHLKVEEGGRTRTSLFRRIGDDRLDGKLHPTPWAMLDRQFFIKLQGEDEPGRRRRQEEAEAVKTLCHEVGYDLPEEFWKREGRSAGGLMSETVDLCSRALRRHGQRARIAHNLAAETRVEPGGREVALDRQGRVELIAETLVLWRELAVVGRWRDAQAASRWDEHVRPLVGETDLSALEETEEGPVQGRKRRAALMERLRPLAEKLADDPARCRELSDMWAGRWREEDGESAVDPASGRRVRSATGWYGRLRWLKDWILPRGAKAGERAIRRVGGLSLTRLATIRGLYRLQKAFHMRPMPQDLRANVPAKGSEEMDEFGQDTLDALERMRENRVKQLASRIAEAALGIGMEQTRADGLSPARPRERVRAPCHAVVVENLRHYRPEQVRTRRENRQLMTWSAAKVRKALSEACELHGLHFREVPAGYTSRQDSRTGGPGMRCEDVPVSAFLGEAGIWAREIKAARRRIEAAESKGGTGMSRDRFLCDLHAHLSALAPERRPPTVRLPRFGGEIFVPVDGRSPVRGGLQADLNAAANIGLRALMDPDWPGTWWYVPCERKTGKPDPKRVKGSSVFAKQTALGAAAGSKAVSDKRPIVNYWRNPSAAHVGEGRWQPTSEYWSGVEFGVVKRLRRQAGLDVA